jgi:predicted RNA-binding protein YlqC (UPF0109 family)
MTNVEQSAETLSSLIKPLLEEPENLSIRVSELGGRVNFNVQVGARDVRSVVGAKGRHLRALQLFAECIGANQGEVFALKLIDPEESPSHAFKTKPEPPDDYTPADEVKLFQDVLDALGINAGVECVGGLAGGFTFTIYPEGQEDMATLCDPHPALYSPNQMQKEPLNLISALRTWFNAIAKSKGLSFATQIE